MPDAFLNKVLARSQALRRQTRLFIHALLLVAAGCSGVPGAEPASAVASEPGSAAQQRLAAKGRSQFLRCNSCHVVDATAPPPFGGSLGPHLEHIVGRRSASVEDFAYTEQLRALDLVWDEETLDKWLQQPHETVPGMCETFDGMANAEQRMALIAYLKNPEN
jgi:cytochrome c